MPCSHRAILTTVVLLCCCSSASRSSAADDDPRDIVRRAMVLNSEESKLQKEYTYLERDEERKLNGKGEVSSRDSKTWDITQINNRQFRRLVQHNDQPLNAKEDTQEQVRQRQVAARIAKTQEQHANDTPDQRQQRQEAARKRRQASDERDADDAIGSHDLKLLGSEEIDGVPVWVIEGIPRSGYKFRDKDNAPMAKIQGRVWISKSDFQLVKIEAESTDTISFGAILARIQKGARIHVEFARVNGEVWLPKHFAVTVAARLLLVKGLHEDLDITYSNYKKFAAESKIVE
jgi:hypothetical protein